VDHNYSILEWKQESDYPNIQYRHMFVKSNSVSRKPNISADHSIPLWISYSGLT